jgi:hypothetical protein
MRMTMINMTLYNYDHGYDPGRMDQSQDPYRHPVSRWARIIIPSPLFYCPSEPRKQHSFGVSKSTAGPLPAPFWCGQWGDHRQPWGSWPGRSNRAGLGAVGGYVVGHQIESRDQSLMNKTVPLSDNDKNSPETVSFSQN